MRRTASSNDLRRAPLSVATALALLLLSGCNPDLNWRETRITNTDLTAMLPCKPARHQRSAPLAGLTVTLHMTACDAEGASFAISHASIPDASAAAQVLDQWRKTTLANIATTSVTPAPGSAESTLAAPSSTSFSASFRVAAQGTRGDGRPVSLQGLWFAQGTEVFHAAVYAPSITADMSETFFSGLKFQ